MLTLLRNAESRTCSKPGPFMQPLCPWWLKETGMLQVLTVCFHQPPKSGKAGVFGIVSLRTTQSHTLEVHISYKTTALRLFTDFFPSRSGNCN